MLGAALTGFAVWKLSQIVPLVEENSREHLGVYYFSFFDGPVTANKSESGCTLAVSQVYCKQPSPSDRWIVESSE